MQKEIHGKKGLVFAVLLILSTIGVMGILGVLKSKWQFGTDVNDFYQVGPGIVIMLALIAFLLTTQVHITRESIAIRSFFFFLVRKTQRWSEITAIKVPVYIGADLFGYNMILERRDSKPGGLIIASFFDNRHEIIKASIEAVTKANPRVKIDDLLIKKYGLPPYGIFAAQEVDS